MRSLMYPGSYIYDGSISCKVDVANLALICPMVLNLIKAGIIYIVICYN
jgi:hypothetical protein